MFVLNALRQVLPRKYSDLRFQDMGRGRCAAGDMPGSLVKQKCRLFLGARQGESEVFCRIDTKRRVFQLGELTGDCIVCDRRSRDDPGRTWVFPFWQELQSAHTIAPDGSQQTVSISPISPVALGKTAAGRGVIGKQVVEYGNNWRANVALFTEW